MINLLSPFLQLVGDSYTYSFAQVFGATMHSANPKSDTSSLAVVLSHGMDTPRLKYNAVLREYKTQAMDQRNVMFDIDHAHL